ncbi:HlyD family secretion protein [Undibacterium sp. Di27W]|uniref:HlyD family secretion protein n=1 Tax=Undibacterium sp. Di27W TaxID=3413036 RepID=UPI003BF14B70
MRQSLFRTEALQSRQQKMLGDILLIRPLTFTLLTIGLAAFAIIVILFFCFASYTSRVSVSGYLVPDLGVVKVFPQQAGIIIEKKVHEGQAVKQGDVLFILSSERQSSTLGETQAAISQQVELRRQSLHDELNKTRVLHTEEKRAMQAKLASVKKELLNLDNQLQGQRERLVIADNTYKRFDNLQKQHFISNEQLLQKQTELLDQKNKLQTLEREYINVSRELNNQEAAFNNLPIQQQSVLSQMERSITTATQELSESEAKRRLLITAPESGIVTQVMEGTGQLVDASRPLLSIVPAAAKMQAHLYAPSRAIGFIKPGDKVLLRYQAYPYQQFGQAIGHLKTVSRTASPLADISAMQSVTLTTSNTSNTSNEGLYKLTVDLEKQDLLVHGVPQNLQSGMALDADIMQEKRKLYEWVLSPLFSITSKI